MKIAVIAHSLRVAGGLVIGRNLVAALPRLGPDHDYLMIVPAGLGYETPKGCGNVQCIEVRPMSFFRRVRFDLFDLENRVRSYRPDVILGLGNLGLPNPPCPQAILFHKSQLTYPARHCAYETALAKWKNRMLKRRLKTCLPKTQWVFCQTPVAKNRFAGEFGYPAGRIGIMPNAVSEFVKLDRLDVATPAVLKDSRDFNLFFLTKYYAHKNLEALLELYTTHADKLKGTRCIITIAAEQHPHAAGFLNDIARRGLEDKIVNVGPLNDTELAGYFYGCDALLFPTLLESFSGTYLEAMHFGVPILTSDLDFARYICGEAAVYFCPWDPADMVDKIITLKNNPALRDELVGKGRARLASFFKHWDDIAVDVLRSIERIAQ